MEILLLIALLAGVIYLACDLIYRSGTYFKATKTPYLKVKSDKGIYGEYLTYKNLRGFEKRGAVFLFNLYIPSVRGETTEIDLVMICQKGIFVFESKNYGGWIFGSEDKRFWHQTLPAGRGGSRKNSFYNPIMQNRAHIKHLKALLGEDIPMRSVIVFSERCSLKAVTVQSGDVHVIKRGEVLGLVNRLWEEMADALTSEAVEEIKRKLVPYIDPGEGVKAAHIENVREHSQKNRRF